VQDDLPLQKGIYPGCLMIVLEAFGMIFLGWPVLRNKRDPGLFKNLRAYK
jgi:hypothetical protein